MTDESKPNESGKAGEMPLFDFTKLLSQFRIPGVDFASIVDRERKNIEALAEANRVAFEGWQALIRRQSEILQEAMKQAVADASQEDALKRRADLAKDRFESALNNMRELAEMATKSQKDAFDVVRKRVEENMESFRNFGKKSE
jgi:phasin family protein